MHNNIKIIILPLALLMVGSCSHAIDKTLSPPADTKWVNIEVKNPSQYTKPFPIEVRYISNDCQKKRVSGFDGSVISEPGYNVTKVPMQQQEGDIWKTKVAMSGGGACKWTLSAINLGIEYIDATHLGKGLVPGTAVGTTIAFDNDASRNGQFDIVAGNQYSYSPTYYPFVKQWSNGSQSSMQDKLYLFGKDDAFYKVRLNIITDKNINIKYNPSIDESKKVLMQFPSEKGRNAMYTFIYSDGSVIKSKDTKPDFRKISNANDE